MINSWARDTDKAKPQTNTAFNLSYYSGVAFPANQYAKATVSGHTSGNAQGVVARWATGVGGYAAFANFGGAGTTIAPLDAAAANGSALSTEASTTWADGDTIELCANGTALTCYRNGSIISALTTTDGTFASGSAGIWTFTSDQLDRLDAFEAGGFIRGGLSLLGAG